MVLCSISMYRYVRLLNREHIENYKEIYIKVSRETLFRRDQKGLYSTGAKNVVGIDLPFEEPQKATVVIPNDGDSDPLSIVEQLEKTLWLY